MKDELRNELFFGEGLVSGTAVGIPYFIDTKITWSNQKQLTEEQVFDEVSRFMRSLNGAKEDLVQFSKELKCQNRSSELKLVESHIELLQDPFGIPKLVIQTISEKRKTAESSLRWVLGELRRRFRVVCNTLISERFTDIEDVVQRLFEQLKLITEKNFAVYPEGAILVAEHISFSQALRASASVSGFVASRGSVFSHTAILARARSIPYVVDVNLTQFKHLKIKKIFVDGDRGLVVVNPTAAGKWRRPLAHSPAPVPVMHFRGIFGPIRLMANVEQPADLLSALQVGLCEVGLLRTEYLFSKQLEAVTSLPSEEEQVLLLASCNIPGFSHYVIRALDMSEDKFPLLFKGARGLQFLLGNPRFFKAHLRAIIKAFPQGCYILLPFVSDRTEFDSARVLFEEALFEITGHLSDSRFKLGAMIETPKGVLEIDEILKTADFISIGSNDLIQYALGIDRSTTVLSVSSLMHPGVLELFSSIITAAREASKPCTLCGEIAYDEAVLPLLIDLGLNGISLAPKKVKEVRNILNRVKLLQMRDVVNESTKIEAPISG